MSQRQQQQQQLPSSRGVFIPNTPRVVFIPNAIHTQDIAQLKTQCTQIYHHLIQLKSNYTSYQSCMNILLSPNPISQDYSNYATSNLYRFLAACQFHLSSTQKHFHIGLNPFLHKLYQSHSKHNLNDQLIDKFKMDLANAPPTTTTAIVATPTTQQSPSTEVLAAQGAGVGFYPSSPPQPGSARVKPVDIPQPAHEIVGLVDNTYATTRYYITKSVAEIAADNRTRMEDKTPFTTRLAFEHQLIMSATNINTQNNAYLYPSQQPHQPPSSQSETMPHRHLIGDGDGNNGIPKSGGGGTGVNQLSKGQAVLPPNSNKVLTRKVQFGLPFAGSKAAIKDMRSGNPTLATTNNPENNNNGQNGQNITPTAQSRTTVTQLRTSSTLTATQALMLLSDMVQKFPEYAQRMLSQASRLQTTIQALLHNYRLLVDHFDKAAKVNSANANLPVSQLDQMITNQQQQPAPQEQQPLIPLPSFPQAELAPIRPPMMDIGQLSQSETNRIMDAIMTHSQLNHYTALARGPVQLPLAPHFQLLLYALLAMAPGSEVGKSGPLRPNFGIFQGWDYPTQTHYISTIEKFKKALAFSSYTDPSTTISPLGCNGISQHFFNGLSSLELVFFAKTLPNFLQTKFALKPPTILGQPSATQPATPTSSHQQQLSLLVSSHSQHLSIFPMLSNSLEALYSFPHLKQLQAGVQNQLVTARRNSIQQAMTIMGLASAAGTGAGKGTIPHYYSPITIPTQQVYLEHIQYYYQRLIATFSSALHTASLLYTSLPTSCDIMLITKTATHLTPITTTYHQYSLPYTTLLTLTQPTVSLTIFYKLLTAIYNLPVTLMTYQQYHNHLIEQERGQQHQQQQQQQQEQSFATQTLLPLLHDAHTQQILCHFLPVAPRHNNNNNNNNSTGDDSPSPCYQLPSTDIIGLNIIIPTAYQLYIPLHYSPLIVTSPTTPVVPYTIIQNSNNNNGNTINNNLPRQPIIPTHQPLTIIPPSTQQQTLPSHHNLTTLVPRSIHYGTIIDLSLRATLIPPSPTPIAPSPLPLHPQFPYLGFPTRLASQTIPMVLPYTVNIITHLQGSTAAPTYAQSISSTLPIPAASTTLHMSQTLAIPSHYKLLQTALQACYLGYQESSQIQTRLAEPIVNGIHSMTDHVLGGFYREMGSYFTRLGQFQQQSYKRRSELYNHDLAKFQQQQQQQQQQPPTSTAPAPATTTIKPIPPILPATSQIQLQPTQTQSIWNLVTNHLTHTNITNLLPFIILSVSNLSKFLYPITSPAFDPTSMSSSQYSMVPHTPNQAWNPLWTAAIDHHITHINISLTGLVQPKKKSGMAMGDDTTSTNTKDITDTTTKQVFVSTTYAGSSTTVQQQQLLAQPPPGPTPGLSKKENAKEALQQQQHAAALAAQQQQTFTDQIPILITALAQCHLEPKLLPFMNRKNPLTMATATPIYSVNLPPMLSQSNQVPSPAQQFQDNLQLSNKITTKLTPTPSSNRRPIRVPRPVYRELDYTPGFVEGSAGVAAPSINNSDDDDNDHKQGTTTQQQQYQPHRSSGDVCTTTRFLAVEQFASLLLPANILKRSVVHDQPIPQQQQSSQLSSSEQPMWYHVFDNVFDLYQTPHHTGCGRREWLSHCKPRAM